MPATTGSPRVAHGSPRVGRRPASTSSPKGASPRTWRPARRASFSACESNVPSVTTIRSPSGGASSSGSSPPSSPAVDAEHGPIVRPICELAELKIPGTGKKVVQARFLDERTPISKSPSIPAPKDCCRMDHGRSNPYFARAAVNRIWAHFFGTGIVDPIDDFDESNPPSHPQLLGLPGDRIRPAEIRREVSDPRHLRQPPVSVVEPADRFATDRIAVSSPARRSKGLTPAELAAQPRAGRRRIRRPLEGTQADRPHRRTNTASPLRAWWRSSSRTTMPSRSTARRPFCRPWP